MTIILILIILILLAGDFVSGRLIYWQRRHINALKKGRHINDDYVKALEEGVEIRDRLISVLYEKVELLNLRMKWEDSHDDD